MCVSVCVCERWLSDQMPQYKKHFETEKKSWPGQTKCAYFDGAVLHTVSDDSGLIKSIFEIKGIKKHDRNEKSNAKQSVQRRMNIRSYQYFLFPTI